MSILTLSTNETINVEDGASLGAFVVVTDDILGTWAKFTDEALSSVTIANDDGTVTATYVNLTCPDNITVTKDGDTVKATFPIREKTELEILKEKLAQIEAEQSEQNDAIDSLTDAALA